MTKKKNKNKEEKKDFSFKFDLKNIDKNLLKQKLKSFAKELWETAFFVLVMLIIIKFFLVEMRWIPSASMHPTLIEKDRIVVDRLTRFFREPQRGDIIIFYPPFVTLEYTPFKLFRRLTGIKCDDVAFIKRVVGLPGEKLEIKKADDGSYAVYINDEKLPEPYIQSRYDYNDCTKDMFCGPMIIPEGEYFMMGDNRGNSQDSRYWGFLPKDRIIGRAVTIFWPIKRIRKL